jgi:GNAT superfamily N-acetyltransferase
MNDSVAPTCRKAEASDINSLSQAYCEYLNEFGFTARAPQINKLIGLLIGEPWASIFLWHKGEQLAGFLAGCKSYSSISACTAFHINDLFVFPHYRGQGIAHEMMKTLEDWAKAQGIEKLILVSREDNAALYRSLGYNNDLLSQKSMWKILGKD